MAVKLYWLRAPYVGNSQINKWLLNCNSCMCYYKISLQKFSHKILIEIKKNQAPKQVLFIIEQWNVYKDCFYSAQWVMPK